MATIQDLQRLSQGASFANTTTNGTQTVVVQTNNLPDGSCLGCDEANCEVLPTQAVAFDNATFSRTNAPKLRWNFDTRPAGIIGTQNITLMSNFGPENFEDFPSLTALTSPHFGYNDGGSRFVTFDTVNTSTTITASGGTIFQQTDVGGLLPSNAAIPAGTFIVSVATNGATAVISQAATATVGGLTATIQAPGVFLPNQALINAQPGGPLIAQLNKILSGGSVVSRIIVRFDNSVAANAPLSNLPITTFHLPVDSNDTLRTTVVYDPFCDFCTTTNSGTFTTHAYVFNGPTTFRDGINIAIPDNTFGTLEICYGIINLPNTMASTASAQWL